MSQGPGSAGPPRIRHDRKSAFRTCHAGTSGKSANFARLAGLTARQVNDWARGRALVPQWAALLAATLRDFSPEALTISLEEAEFRWREILGVSAHADTAAARRAMTRLARSATIQTGAVGPSR